MGMGVQFAGAAPAAAPNAGALNAVNNTGAQLSGLNYGASFIPSSIAGLGITPDSSNGCSGEVCITVIGSGLYVDEITVDIRPGIEPPSIGGVAAILWDGSTNEPWGGIWGFPPEYSGVIVTDDFDYPYTGQVCGEIVNYTRIPCETIHS